MRSQMLFALLIVLIVLNCGQKGDTGQQTAADEQSNLPQILVSPKGLVHSFWVTVKSGADSAGKELGANVIWKGPTLETDISGQIAIIEDYINKGVDAIVLAACDATALVNTVKKAAEKNIPVITIDSGLDSDIPLSFIATDNVAAAMKAADALAELIDKKGKVACIPFIPGAATSNMRESGFLTGIKNYPDIQVAAIQYSQSEVAMGMAITEDILTAHPDLKGIFAANEAGTIGVVQGLKSKNKVGQVKVVGFDAAPNEILALNDKTLDALIVQDPFKMGYLGVKTALQALKGETVEKRIDTGVYVVTRENINSPELKKLLGL